MAAVLAAAPWDGLALARQMPPPPSSAPAPSAQPAPAPRADGVLLKVRRMPNAVELVLEEAGPGASLIQRSEGNQWSGELRTSGARGLRVGPQALTLPSEGLERVSLEGSGDNYQLRVTPMAGQRLGNPTISSDGRDLVVRFPAAAVAQTAPQTVRPNLNQPTPVPSASYVPPLRPRAVAPPVGDMAVGTMTLRNPGYVNVSGPAVTLTLKNASAKAALMTLAQLGGYGFAWIEDGAKPSVETKTQLGPVGTAAGASQTVTANLGQQAAPITVAFRGESYSRALNTVLMAAGVQGKIEGNMILVGYNILSKTFGAQVSKVYRLNQVGANAAADYLANLGATVTKTNTITTSVTQGVDEGSKVSGGASSATTQSSSQTLIEAYGASTGPLIGLRATTDNRLGTITLIGDASVILVAENYLRQLDLRQRQVALSVRILDVNLDNDASMANSFAVRWGNNFIVNDEGQLLGVFGKNLPPGYNPLDGFNPSSPAANPGSAYPSNQFFDFLRAQIVSQSTKLLASPTLILQENPSELRDGGGGGGSSGGGDSSKGSLDEYSIDSPIGRRRANEGVVRVGTNVITEFEVSNSSNGSIGGSNVITCEPTLSTAGLVLGARIEKIDDNGFVTFALSPSVSAVTDRQPVQGCGNIDILSIRRLDTGALRVRDGQTLILTGVISDFDRAEVRKWPILGDIPIIGSLFRASGTRREKRELVIMVTPRIISDGDAGVYGYGYRPETQDARSFMGSAVN